VRRLLGLLAIMTGVLALAVPFGASARAATLPECLASKHVCVSSDARALVSQSQQSQLEQQIGSSAIYLVVAPSGSSGYDSAMRQLISDLGATHDQFVVGFLDTRRLHFGAYNRGILPSGGAASIATTAVDQHRSDGDTFGALRDFVRDVQHQAGSSGAAGGSSASSSSGALTGLIVVGVLVLLGAGGYLLFLRPRRKRKREEQEQQLKEAKLAAQDDLIALNARITDHDNDVTIAGNPEAAAEQAAALDAYERGTRALDAAHKPAEMGVVSRSIAEGQYRLACAEALAHGLPKPGRRPMCFFDPRHGMSVADVSWAPPDGGPSRMVAACIDCQRIVERGDQPVMRTVEDRSGSRVPYVNSGFAPSYWGGFGIGGGMLAGFLLGEALAGPAFVNNYYGGPEYFGGGYGPEGYGDGG
jgi:hypothetical protein